MRVYTDSEHLPELYDDALSSILVLNILLLPQRRAKEQATIIAGDRSIEITLLIL
jgi:hypothetical protein